MHYITFVCVNIPSHHTRTIIASQYHLIVYKGVIIMIKKKNYHIT